MSSSHTSDRSPLVGVTTYRERAAWGVWDLPADVLPCGYADAVVQAGAVPVLVPPLTSRGAAARVIEALDALVITGGADIDPQRYGAVPHERTLEWRSDRDESELLLLDAAKARRTPVLGICRGMQLMAVAEGGSLVQHHPELVASEAHSPGGSEYGATRIRVVAGTDLHRVLGDTVDVWCHHHQSVAEHPGFLAAARAADGTLEALQSTEHPWLGVQWHPEVGGSPGVFAWLTGQTRPAVGTRRR